MPSHAVCDDIEPMISVYGKAVFVVRTFTPDVGLSSDFNSEWHFAQFFPRSKRGVNRPRAQISRWLISGVRGAAGRAGVGPNQQPSDKWLEVITIETVYDQNARALSKTREQCGASAAFTAQLRVTSFEAPAPRRLRRPILGQPGR